MLATTKFAPVLASVLGLGLLPFVGLNTPATAAAADTRINEVESDSESTDRPCARSTQSMTVLGRRRRLQR